MFTKICYIKDVNNDTWQWWEDTWTHLQVIWSQPYLKYSFPSYLSPGIHSDKHFIELCSLDKMLWAWIIFSKVLVSLSKISYWNKKNEWKMQTGTSLLTNFRSESASMNGIVLFWKEMDPTHYGQQASFCSVISKLLRRGCWFFFSLAKCFPCCQADRQWKPACRKHEILASVRTPKSPWRFWQRERWVHRQ